MSKTVGLPVAVAVRLILDKKISSRGVLRPTLKEVYEPAMQMLDAEGIHFKHTSRPYTKMEVSKTHH